MLCRPPIKSRRPGWLPRLIALSWASNTSMGNGTAGKYLLTCSLTDPLSLVDPQFRNFGVDREYPRIEAGHAGCAAVS